MNTAQQIVSTSKNASEAMTQAGEIYSASSNQDWENESTTWEFEDGSKLFVCGNEFKVV